MQTEELDHYLSQEPVTLPDGAQISLRDASALDFRESVITDATFEYSSLKGGNFSVALFRFCTFQGVNFSSSVLDSAEFVGCKFQNCYFGKATSQDARFENCRFTSCDMRSSYFERARFESCLFDCCDLSISTHTSVFAGARFEMTQFHACRLEAMDADGAHLITARLDGCNLSGMAISGGNLFASTITSSNMREVYFDYTTIDNTMIGGDIHDADFSGALIRESDLTEAVGNVLQNDETLVVESEIPETLSKKETN